MEQSDKQAQRTLVLAKQLDVFAQRTDILEKRLAIFGQRLNILGQRVRFFGQRLNVFGKRSGVLAERSGFQGQRLNVCEQAWRICAAQGKRRTIRVNRSPFAFFIIQLSDSSIFPIRGIFCIFCRNRTGISRWV